MTSGTGQGVERPSGRTSSPPSATRPPSCETDACASAREALLSSEAEWRHLIETMPQIVWITRPDGWHVHFNQQWTDFTGLSVEESLGHGWNPAFHPDDQARAAALWHQAITTGEPYEIEYRLRRADGIYHWMLGRATPLRDASGTIVKWFGTCTDIQELKQTQARVSAQARLLDQTQDAIVVHDLDHRVLYWNAGAQRIHGWSAAEARGRTLDELICPHMDQVEVAVRAVLRDGEWNGELHYVSKRGDALIMEGRWTLLRHDDGTPRSVLAVNTDVTERRTTEAELLRELETRATHDELTGLPNRALLGVRLEEALERRQGHDGGVTLLLCDLDDFKIVNDALGHPAGDQVLAEVARRLRDSVRDRDLVARLGGDEFAILLEEADEETVQALTDRLLEIVPRPVVLDTGQPVEVGLSIGVADSGPLHDEQSLLRDADATLYHAKHRGKLRAERFDDQLRLEVLERLALPQQLRAGLADDELFCLHQPEIDLTTGRLFAFESLVRWQHPERGLLGPARFVPLAEAAGLSGELFTRVLEDTLAAQQRWATRLGFRPATSVNLSARQLDDESLPGNVAMALTRTDTPADLLWLEVTETALAGAGSFPILNALRDLGVHIVIDDFGTGWSSLARLSEFQFDMLKIDRSFTSRLAPGNRTEHMVRATVVMAHALGMLTVAEGVETPEQLDILTAMGCDIAQGYLFARPVEARDALTDIAADGTWVGPGQRAAWQPGSAPRP
jgi:diguanylate cyclase (GGDEF)-like protein/PAS domain S-box-containing protein